ncbi:MAG TPA: glycosyltransferase family 39 protein [Anaerolineales bacterium]|nr:glycosyltransferase family 39 protein [Anaerolineales bacterium]
MPEEPSVLDYLKSKLKFWEHGEKIHIPVEPETPLEIQPETAQVELPPETVPVDQDSIAMAKPPREKPAEPNRWPWRSLLALALALVAQRSWDSPTNRTATLGLVLYTFALALLVWAYVSKEWTLAALPETSMASDTLQVRRLPLILAIPLTLAAFLTMNNNLFTGLNVTLWVLAIICVVWGFWLPGQGLRTFWARFKAFFKGSPWQINLTRLTLLILVMLAIIGFFRIYNLTGVPSNPTSDHAEKLLDVYDVSQGLTHIFFPRNTGREAIQMYLTLVVSWIFGTGLSYLSLKIGTVICGLATLPYMYLLGKEIGGKRVGLLAVFFTGIAYWPNVISRFGLRFPLYPLFVAPTLYYLLRGLRARNRNDMILSGLFLGFGLHGYTPMRIIPIVVMAAIGLYLLHPQSKGNRKQAVTWLIILALVSMIVFLPLARYWVDNPDSFTGRAFSRLGTPDNPLPGPAWKLFLSNTWNALRMFNWNDGDTWVSSIVFRPALDIVSGALFLLGAALVLIRYLRNRHWLDLFLLLSLPLLELPSILSLAFPIENPVLSRAGAAFIPAFLIVAMALDGLLKAIKSRMNRQLGSAVASILIILLAGFSIYQNYDLVFNQYADMYSASQWNASEMGAVIKEFKQVYGTTDSVWIVASPYWVDTRLPGDIIGIPNRDFAIAIEDFDKTAVVKGPKLFIVRVGDTKDEAALKQLYPQGQESLFHSATHIDGMNFLIFFIPANSN